MMEGTGQNFRKSALDIYRAGYNGRFLAHGTELSGDKNFFFKLRNAIVWELENQGFCQWVDMLFEMGPKDGIDVVACAVLQEVAQKYRHGHWVNDELSDYIPCQGIKHRILWGKICKGEYLVRKETLGPILHEVRHGGQWEHLSLLKREREGRANSAAELPADQLEAAVEKARMEAIEQVRADISQQAYAEAREKAYKEAYEAARKQAYADVRDEIYEEVEQRVYAEASKRAWEAAQRDAETRGNRLVEQYLKQERLNYRQKSEAELYQVLQKGQKDLDQAERFHEEMCSETDALYADWSQAMDEAVQRMEGVKNDVYKMLRKWQTGLYPREFRQIAERYTELYRILYSDQLLTNQILYEEQAGREGGVSPAIRGLQELQNNLEIILRKFEASLHGLGMYVYLPQPGEEFEPGWHVCDDDTDAEGKSVARTITPGVARKYYDSDVDDVIVPAVVTVGE